MVDISRVLLVTSEWPSAQHEISGIHIYRQAACLRGLGLTVDVFPFRGKMNPLRYAQTIRRFRQLDLKPYDIIHAHHGQSGIVALAQSVAPVVVTFHGSDVLGLRNRAGHPTRLGYVLQAVTRWVATRANQIILVSQHLCQYLPQRPYHVIPAGIDFDLFCPQPLTQARQTIGMPMDKRLVLFVGDPARPEKRYALARQVIALLNTDSAIDLVVADRIPPNQMPLYLNACDAMLVTSFSEGSPAAVKEALACNLPIVSVDVGDIRERIAAIDGCVVCADDKPTTLAGALAQVLARGQRIAGRETVTNLDERKLVRQVVRVYEQAVRERNES